tara:strand:+ start:1273 stop:2463 length:1191 start_codon:yes stop_codon:yes gene_type:complete
MATTSFTITNFTANGNEQTLTNQAGEVQVVTNYFPYLRDADVKVSVKAAGASSYTQKDIVTHWTINDSKHIVFKENVLTGSVVYSVLVRRDTDITSSRVSFQTGSSVNAGDLNTNSTQLRYSIEELDPNTTVSTSEIAIADDAVTTAKILNDNVTYAKLQDIGTANRVLGKASTGTVEEVQIVEAMIADNAVSMAKLSSGTLPTDIVVNQDNLASNSVTLAKLASALVTSLQSPVGTVIWYAGSTAPAGYLKCNGDAIANGSGTTQSITTDFSALYAIVGANLPDLRGEFIRGWDDGKGTDSGRSIRTSQGDQNEAHTHSFSGSGSSSHTHSYSRLNSTDDEDRGIPIGSGGDAGSSFGTQTTQSATVSLSISGNTASSGGESRPRNIALLACIKY